MPRPDIHPKLRLDAGVGLLIPATLCCLEWQFLWVAVGNICEHSFSRQDRRPLVILDFKGCTPASLKLDDGLENAFFSDCAVEDDFGFVISSEVC